MKHPLFTLCAAASIATSLVACGGGGSSTTTASTATSTTTGTSTSTGTSATATVTTPSTTPATTPSAAPITVTYTAISYLQDLSAAGTTATFTDKGLGMAGSLSLRGLTVSMTPNANADGGIAYGTPFTKGLAVSSNTADSNLPAIAMLCQQAANGNGTNGAQATDVLVASTANRVTQASALANQTFSIYREDCAALSGNTLSFNASGDATLVSTSDGTSTITAANVTAALNNSAIARSAGGYAVFSAYSYVKGNGSTAFAVVVHGGPTVSALARGFVGVYAQQ
jgi:hypothetical protein